MKKYKLLKDLPGCKAGNTLYLNSEDGDKSFVHAAGTGYEIPIKVLKDYSEWFEEIHEWPKSWEDIPNKTPSFCTTEFSNYKQEYSNVQVFLHHPSYKSIIARLKLEEIANEINGDWKPDWSKDATLKYHVCRNRNTLSISDARHYAKLIVFKTKEMAKFSLKKKKKLWEDYWMINK